MTFFYFQNPPLDEETKSYKLLSSSHTNQLQRENRNLEMSDSSQFVSIIPVENSNPISEPQKSSLEIPESTKSVSILVETSEPDSLSGKSDSTVSISSASDDPQAKAETGVTNQAFVDDEDVTVHEKKGHQRSPSCSLGKEEKVSFHTIFRIRIKNPFPELRHSYGERIQPRT